MINNLFEYKIKEYFRVCDDCGAMVWWEKEQLHADEHARVERALAEIRNTASHVYDYDPPGR